MLVVGLTLECQVFCIGVKVCRYREFVIVTRGLSMAECVFQCSYLVSIIRVSAGKQDRKSTRLNSSHITRSRMPSSA